MDSSVPTVHALAIDGASTGGAVGDIDVSYVGGSHYGMCHVSPDYMSSCEFELFSNSQMVLTPMPAPGYAFGGWSGACSGTGPCTVAMDQARQVGARFEPAPVHPFTVEIQGPYGAVGIVDAWVDGFGDDPFIHCEYPASTSCQASYESGKLVRVHASPGVQTVFDHWGGACAGFGDAQECQVQIDDAKTVSPTSRARAR